MAKRKNGNPWDEVFDRVEVIAGDPEIRYSPRPTDAELDQLESQIGSRLPASYRAFMLRFGPCTLEGRVDFSPVALVAQQTLQYRKISPRELRENPHWGWLSSLVYFGDNVAADAYAWDPTSSTNANPHECQIYHLPHGDEENPTVVGGSFAEFATWAYEANASRRPRGVSRSTNILYMRLAEGMKKAPTQKHVKLWLAFNNHAVRDLALSIRDEKRPDVFPILADALEEAGCTNDDMLNSCRTGDPDTDGVWVLRVLLGKES